MWNLQKHAVLYLKRKTVTMIFPIIWVFNSIWLGQYWENEEMIFSMNLIITVRLLSDTCRTINVIMLHLSLNVPKHWWQTFFINSLFHVLWSQTGGLNSFYFSKIIPLVFLSKLFIHCLTCSNWVLGDIIFY